MLMKICKHATRGDVISAESHLPCYTMYLRDLSWFQKGIRDAGESCSDVKGENEGAPVAVVRFPIVELCASLDIDLYARSEVERQIEWYNDIVERIMIDEIPNQKLY